VRPLLLPSLLPLRCDVKYGVVRRVSTRLRPVGCARPYRSTDSGGPKQIAVEPAAELAVAAVELVAAVLEPTPVPLTAAAGACSVTRPVASIEATAAAAAWASAMFPSKLSSPAQLQSTPRPPPSLPPPPIPSIPIPAPVPVTFAPNLPTVLPSLLGTARGDTDIWSTKPAENTQTTCVKEKKYKGRPMHTRRSCRASSCHSSQNSACALNRRRGTPPLILRPHRCAGAWRHGC